MILPAHENKQHEELLIALSIKESMGDLSLDDAGH